MTKSPIKIASIGTYSGFNGQAAKATAQAVQAWAAMTNAHGGINGHPVDVIVKDDQGDPAKSLQAAKSVVQQDHVIAIVGQHESGLESAWASYVDAAKVPVIGGNGVGEPWVDDPNFFPTAATAPNLDLMTEYLTNLLGKKSYGVVYCAEAPACAQAGTLAAQGAKKLGISFAGGLSIATAAPDYTAQCLSLKDKGAEVVFTGTQISADIRFIENCRSNGFDPVFVNNAQNWTAQQTTNPVWDGAWLFSETAPWTGSSDALVQFRDAMKQYQPSAPLNSSATAGWSAAVVFGRAAAQLGDTPTSSDLYAGLYALGAQYDADGLMPPVTYAQGKPAAQKACGWYLQVKAGKVTTPKGEAPTCLD
ncbi:MAG TPA: ABC transporter substrate-binding protein [Mycobacteriales bacterium]|nr:ABC transporter substrate-binding protein [Mycobacteriales bacterium]